VTLQDLILKLSAFWASHGCLLQQPLDLEVGAGTSHPETLFRVLGPKPWSVAYVQPSRRPDDGRFGQNPNRVFKHHQYQVILKPSPDEVLRGLGKSPSDAWGGRYAASEHCRQYVGERRGKRPASAPESVEPREMNQPEQVRGVDKWGLHRLTKPYRMKCVEQTEMLRRLSTGDSARVCAGPRLAD